MVQSKHAAAVWRLKELQSAIEVKEKELRGWGQKVGEMEEANQRLQQEQRRRQRLLESYNEVAMQCLHEYFNMHPLASVQITARGRNDNCMCAL